MVDMKKILLLLMMAVVVFACDKDSDPIFKVDVEGEPISFTAFPGGATMHYQVANNSDIHGIRAVYNDYLGNQKIVEGTHNGAELRLLGFIDETIDIPVKIYYLDKNDIASEPIEKTFNVLDCAAKEIFEDLAVTSFWNGFMVSFTAPEQTDGFIHMARKVKLENGETEIRILESMPIVGGESTFRFTDTTDEEDLTDVIVWTEDFFGNKVRTEEYNDVIGLTDFQMAQEGNFTFHGSSVEDESRKIGAKYLFDGDTKGEYRAETKTIETPASFVSDRNAVPGFWTVEFNEGQKPSRIKVYEAFIQWYELA